MSLFRISDQSVQLLNQREKHKTNFMFFPSSWILQDIKEETMNFSKPQSVQTPKSANGTLVIEADPNCRLDLALAKLFPNWSRSDLQSALKEKAIVLSETSKWRPKLKPALKLTQELILDYNLEVKDSEKPLVPEFIPLDIVYEDDDFLVVNKQKGLCVHPAPGHRTGTLVQALLGHQVQLSSGGHPFRPGIVHRLDMDTSGLLLVAKTNRMHEALSNLLKDHKIEREYVALVFGTFSELKGRIEGAIARDPSNRLKMSVQSNGRSAVTHFSVLNTYGRYTELALALETGRTHQIRVHLSAIGHPVIGDPLYAVGRPVFPIAKTQALHAAKLSFVHPFTQEKLVFEAAPPSSYEALRTLLKEKNH